ncbi:MAG: acetyl-CoA carboxylase, biotin carboxyl carrier protein [Armatimonadetes bacterium]|nr:acetyl-CoA carboxylase, biotin carboxyl carrier protein [Armatimonadota bacterium]
MKKIKINFDLINEIIDFAKDNNLSSLSIAYEDLKIGIKFPKENKELILSSTSPLTKEEHFNNNLMSIKAPLSGIFYRSGHPGGAPLVDIGDTIEIGQVLCIIEAMKLMNEIVAEASGTLKKVEAKNGNVVNEGEILFWIDPKI